MHRAWKPKVPAGRSDNMSNTPGRYRIADAGDSPQPAR
jgi:hypothetical protein